MITLKDIAKDCGVSIATVSIILNNKPNRFSEETIRKVNDAAKKLNYQPNNLAVSLVKGTTQIIGLIVPDISNEYFSNLAFLTDLYLTPHYYTMMIGNANNDPQKDLNHIKKFISYKVDGLIIVPSPNYDNSQWESLKSLINSSSIPTVFLDRIPLDKSFPYFVTDNELGGYIATKHLLSLGHRKIGVLTGPSNLENTQERLKGYLRAYEELNLPVNKNFLFEGDFSISSGSSSFHYFKMMRTTAIFSFNDVMAFGLYRAAFNDGANIPSDLSIVGFDNNSITAVSNPSLTTVSQPVRKMCFETCQFLLAKINNTKSEYSSSYFKPDLIIRKSTLPPHSF